MTHPIKDASSQFAFLQSYMEGLQILATEGPIERQHVCAMLEPVATGLAELEPHIRFTDVEEKTNDQTHNT